MATTKHRYTISLDRARAETLRRFAEQWDLSVSQVITAILEPVVQSIAWELSHSEADQPSLFPDRLTDLFAFPDDLDPRDSLYRMEAAFIALRQSRRKAIKSGFPAALLASGEDAPDGPTGPLGAPASGEAQPPHTNRGVTLKNQSLPLPLPKPKKVRQG